ncbi:MAG: nucleotidyltransferase domain-containing protein [Pseudomonadota bacterium]
MMIDSPPAHVDADLERLLARIVPAFRAEAVYLFGLRAREDSRGDSDYDLLVVVPDDTPAKQCNVIAGFEATRGLGIAADVFPCRRSRFERYKDEVGTLTYTARHYGRLVYGR